MSTKPDKPPCQAVRIWLRDNLGKQALGCLTGQSARSLSAAVHLMALYSYCDSDAEPHVLMAFRHVVLTTHEGSFERELIYHSIAYVMEWSTRDRVWALCSLPPIENRHRCKYES